MVAAIGFLARTTDPDRGRFSAGANGVEGVIEIDGFARFTGFATVEEIVLGRIRPVATDLVLRRIGLPAAGRGTGAIIDESIGGLFE